MQTLLKSEKIYILIILSIFTLFIFLIYFSSVYFFMSDYLKIENKQNQNRIEKLFENIEKDVDGVQSRVIDYAQWDDTYDFIQSFNPVYPQSNFPEEANTLENLGLNFFIYINSNIKVHYLVSEEFDGNKVDTSALSNWLINYLKSAPKKSTKGLIRLNGVLYILAVEPIIKSNKTGKFVGYLVGGKLLSKKYIKQYAQGLFESVQSKDLNTLAKDAQYLPRQKQSFWKKTPYILIQKQDEKISDELLFFDLNATKVLRLHVENRRYIYTKGLETVKYYTVAVFFIVFPLIMLQIYHHILFIRREKRIAKMKSRLDKAQKISHVGNYEWNVQTESLVASEELYRIFGFEEKKEEILYKDFHNAIIEEDREKYFIAINAALNSHSPINIMYKILTQDGREKTLKHQGNIVFDDKNEPLSVIGTIQDVTQQVEYEEEIKKLAFYDPLTLLPNRRMLSNYIDHALATAHRSKKGFAIFYMDMDNFKHINDTLGHSYGDRALQEVTRRFLSTLREEDILARVGGDEFIALLENVGSLYDIGTMAQRIIKSFELPLEFEGHKIPTSFSLGIALYPEHGRSQEQLIQNSDVAMYHAKKSGKNMFHFYTDDMQYNMQEYWDLDTALREAIEKNEMMLYYQPKIIMPSSTVCGVEALIRWKDKDKGFIPPDKFIPLAEESGLIVSLGEWVLNEACRQQKEWAMKGIIVKIAVNVSMYQLRKINFISMLKKIIEKHEVDPTCIEIEITESLLMENAKQILPKLKELRHMGLVLSIDDFGTGYSSMSYLQKLPIDKLKIDKSFIDDITENDGSRAIVSSMIALAHALELKVVAEGVEEEGQIDILNLFNCDVVQGFYFSKPLDKEKIFTFLQTHELNVQCHSV